ncbi:unnamed protein product [Arabis nemorensis]|uniref:Uncharacterized protein n=1 Tax=Arabis nemorensis TaxID=586526 RepID=A0A565BI76_9BRAS|nr:unnamed protein product [Arabis nemorensis]
MDLNLCVCTTYMNGHTMLVVSNSNSVNDGSHFSSAIFIFAFRTLGDVSNGIRNLDNGIS